MALLEIESWEALPLSVGVDRLLDFRTRSTAMGPTRKAWAPGGSLSPADLYCYLKARFGQPNGTVMLTTSATSDNVIHWHYTIVTGDESLEIYGISSRIELVALSVGRLCDEDWTELVCRLKADFARFGEKMKKVRDSLERWTIFVNPYYRLENAVADLHARIVDLDLKVSDLPEVPKDKKGLLEFQERAKELGLKYAEAAELGISLRMITPVWGESFVNLLIFLLATDYIKSDRRLYEDLLRREIDIRVTLLHQNCDGFRSPVDRKVGPVKEFLTVMNARNDYLHGNVDPRKLAVDSVFFEGKRPIFPRYQTFTERSLAPRLKQIEPERVIQDIYRVEAFMAYVLERLEPSVREEVKIVMASPLPGWREDTGRIGVLFSDTTADFVIPELWRPDSQTD